MAFNFPVAEWGIGLIQSIPDISRVGCAHMQGIRATDVVVYLKALITQQVSAPGSPEG